LQNANTILQMTYSDCFLHLWQIRIGMVITEINGQVGYVILNRLEKKNAFNPEMIQAIKDAFIDLEANPIVKVVVLSSNSDVFCAGADLEYLKQLQFNSFEDNLKDSEVVKSLFELIYTYPKITIAQVEGHAIAGGSGLATACDFCYAVPEAKFGYTEVRIGFTPAIVSVFLIRKIGEAKARELLLSGKLISSSHAQNIGMISEVFEVAQIKEKVAEIAGELARVTSAESILMTKSLLNELYDKSLPDAMNLGALYNAKMRETADFKKGITSFINKEKLTW
jgi:methylglutaconyl-CoA hydratase